MIINLNCKISAYQDHILYVLGFLNDHPLLPEGNQFSLNALYAEINIDYGESDSGDFQIPIQRLIFEDEVISNSGLFCNQYTSESHSLFSIETAQKEARQFLIGRTFGFDIFETIFFHISRYEEYQCEPSKKDKWDMMWEEQQILVRENLYHIPVIDHLVFAFFDNIGLQPKQQKTTFSLSHDIDVVQKFKNPYRIFRSSVRALLDNGVNGFLNHLKYVGAVKRNTQKDPYDTFDFLLIDSSTNQFKEQVVYIMAGGQTNKENHYQINDKNITSVLSKAMQLGYKIGLHASYVTHQNGNQFIKEKDHLAKAINKNIQHNRQHFLHFDFKETPKILETAGIEFDSSLGYQRLIGFRCGTGFPYHLYDFDRKQAFLWKEQPMVIMDGSLLNEAKNDMQNAESLLDTFLDKNQWNTHVTFNVHNTIFDPSKRDVEKMKVLYSQMISLGK